VISDHVSINGSLSDSVCSQKYYCNPKGVKLGRFWQEVVEKGTISELLKWESVYSTTTLIRFAHVTCSRGT